MDTYVKAITLDVNAVENYTVLNVKQGDKVNRKLAITLKKDGANFAPAGVSKIQFREEKPDKNFVIVQSTDSGTPITVAGNVYTVSLVEQCLTVSGEAWCDIAFLDASGNTLSSAAFVMNIIPMPNGDTARSISEWTDLQNAIDDAERFASIVAFRTSGNYIQYTVDGTTWVNLTTVGAIGGNLQTQIDNLNGAISDVEDIVGDGSLTGFTATDLTGAANELNGAITDVQGQICAYVENGNNATRAYSAGGYVVWKGNLYRIIAFINNGDAFTVNTNIASVTIGNEIKQLSGSGTLNTNLFTEGSANWVRIGRLVIINVADLKVKSDATTAHNNSVFTGLPAIASPQIFLVWSSNSTASTSFRLKVDGTILKIHYATPMVDAQYYGNVAYFTTST